MEAWTLDSLRMRLLGLAVAGVLGGAVLDAGVATAAGVVHGRADASVGADPGTSAQRSAALACVV